MKKRLIPLILIALAAGGWYGWKHFTTVPAPAELKLYGNVDIRQVSPAFERSGRIIEVMAEEGDSVAPGQLLARMDVRTLELQCLRVEAEIAVQEQNLRKLENGSRPEETARAEAALRTADARLEQARRDERRMAAMRRGNSVSPQEYELSQLALRVAKGQHEEAAQVLALLKAGARTEDVAMAAAQLEAARASLALLRHEISLGELRAPTAAVVSSRLLEPGDMASPASPVFLLSLTSPKWVRAYVSETQLGRVRHGMTASIHTDSFPEAVPGRIGYIAPQAEFTPKSVQTEELRTALVYEVRIVTEDPLDRLRLGMPVSAIIHEGGPAGASHVE